MLISEACDASWSSHSLEPMWIFDELSDTKSIVRNWLRECIPKPDIVLLAGVNDANHVTVEVPLITYLPGTKDQDNIV